MKIVAVIQARMGSTRLPGKVLQDLGGRSMLARVVRRSRRARHLDDVVVATTRSPHDDGIVTECQQLDVAAFRGDEDDVLDRYYRAANHFAADVIVRITSDCPLIDPAVIDRVVAAFRGELPDYASNTLHRTYPQGLDTEAISSDALERTWQEAKEPFERTHVTPFIYQHPESFRLLSVTDEEDNWSHHRWTVDTTEDLCLARALYERLGNDNFGWRDALALFDRQPELVAINQHVRQKALAEG